jgi:L-fuconolactonase
LIIRTAGQVDEPILEPELEIIDAHHHFFPEGTHSWPGLENYTLDELLADTGAGHRVVGTVWVEANGGLNLSPLEEVRLVAEYAQETVRRGGTVVQGLVGSVDLREGAAAGETLDRMNEAGGGRFKGIRHATLYDTSPDIYTYPGEPGPELLRKPEFQKGFAELARRNMTFDAWLYHPQLLDVAALADAFPETKIVVDHLGGPTKSGPYSNRSETLNLWRRNMSEVAERPNVFLKVGGLGLVDLVEPVDVTGKADVEPTSAQLADYWRPEVRWCIETFGADRCMFESNYPIDNPMCSYTVLWNTFKRIVSDASPDEKNALFSGTATRFYDLKS